MKGTVMDYREGKDDHEDEINNDVVDESSKNQELDGQQTIPNTGFFVIQYPDGRVDVSVDIPGLEVDHQPGMREIRDISHSLYLDMNNMIHANQFGSQFQKALVAATKKKEDNKVKTFSPQIVRPTR